MKIERSVLSLLVVVLCGCGSPNPLVGRWTMAQPFPPSGAGSMASGTVTSVIEFGADNTLNATYAGSAGCTGTVTMSNFRISLNPMSPTSGTFVTATLGTCTGGPVMCTFGSGPIAVAQCGAMGFTGAPTSAAQYVLSADGRTLSLNGQILTRVN